MTTAKVRGAMAMTPALLDGIFAVKLPVRAINPAAAGRFR
jgi:hypothetical protein